MYRLGMSSLYVSVTVVQVWQIAYVVPDSTCGPSEVAAWTNTEHRSSKKLAKKVDRIVKSVYGGQID
jgi:hypothetical protein